YSQRPPDAEIASWGVTDRELVVLLLERPDGRPAIVLTHFACHPVTVQVQPLVSADFPGVLTSLVERAAPGCEQCLFLQGAAGSSGEERERLARAAVWADEATARARAGDGPITAEIQALRLGDTAWVAIPGEPFCEMGLAMKGWDTGLRSLCVGYANDALGYF